MSVDLAPVSLATMSRLVLGDVMAARSVGAPGTGFHPAANRAIAMPLRLGYPVVLRQVTITNGATVTGNVDIGIYDDDYRLIVSTGSTAMSGASEVQAIDITDTQLWAGRHYVAFASSVNTATFSRYVFGSAQEAKAVGAVQMASAFPLPSTLTPAVLTSDHFPQVGLFFRASPV